ncbi:MAG: glycerol kinase GlpK [Pseudolabrys sp.]
MAGTILAIDQGTTSTRSIVFDADLAPVASAQEEFTQHFPAPGWVEHDPEDLWRTTVATAKAAVDKAGIGVGDVAAIGIANQRESVVMWDRATGKPIANAIVWQDRRTADRCAQLEADGHGDMVSVRTGLRIDPYFSATKIAWMLDNVPGARRRAENGEIAFGTVDTFLLWRLTGGKVHATDATNASRTLLYDIASGDWDDDMLRVFDVPRAVLPEVRDCAGHFGTTDAALFGKPLDVRGIAGDQQAALIGQACFRPGMVKSTYGTGCFMLRNLGAEPVASRHGLVTTVAYQFGGKRTYALEGSIFSAGTTVQWLRDGLGVVTSAAVTEALAVKADPEQPVYLVPAFTGLGAPYWAPQARATVSGITRGTTRNELARAALESVAYQSRDLLEAMAADAGGASGEGVVRVDGGLSANGWAMQFLADMLGAPVERPAVVETTAVGAAYLAGHDAGLYPPPEALVERWRPERRFEPRMNDAARDAKYAGWQRAITQTLAT